MANSNVWVCWNSKQLVKEYNIHTCIWYDETWKKKTTKQKLKNNKTTKTKTKTKNKTNKQEKKKTIEAFSTQNKTESIRFWFCLCIELKINCIYTANINFEFQLKFWCYPRGKLRKGDKHSKASGLNLLKII